MKQHLPHKDYGTCDRNGQLKIDESFAEKEIPANDSVRLLDKIVEGMDLSALMRAYDSHGRPPATPPRTMLKIVLYAAMEHNYSSRKIKSSCERDMNYIWLLLIIVFSNTLYQMLPSLTPQKAGISSKNFPTPTGPQSFLE